MHLHPPPNSKPPPNPQKLPFSTSTSFCLSAHPSSSSSAATHWPAPSHHLPHDQRSGSVDSGRRLVHFSHTTEQAFLVCCFTLALSCSPAGFRSTAAAAIINGTNPPTTLCAVSDLDFQRKGEGEGERGAQSKTQDKFLLHYRPITPTRPSFPPIIVIREKQKSRRRDWVRSRQGSVGMGRSRSTDPS